MIMSEQTKPGEPVEAPATSATEQVPDWLGNRLKRMFTEVMDEPHSVQNLRPASFSVPQLWQVTRPSPLQRVQLRPGGAARHPVRPCRSPPRLDDQGLNRAP